MEKDGASDGCDEGAPLKEGVCDGCDEGSFDGLLLGTSEGFILGFNDGSEDVDGNKLGSLVGLAENDGSKLG